MSDILICARVKNGKETVIRPSKQYSEKRELNLKGGILSEDHLRGEARSSKTSSAKKEHFKGGGMQKRRPSHRWGTEKKQPR